MNFDSPPQRWQQPPRGPKRKGAIVATAIVATAIAAYIAVNAAGKSPADTITYVVAGSSANVTYGPAGSSLAGSVPMRATAAMGATPASWYAIDAQLQGSGAVTCEILVDGKAVSQAAASGGYGIARCEITRDPLTGSWQDANS